MEICLSDFIKRTLSLGLNLVIAMLCALSAAFAGPEEELPEPVPSIPEIRDSIVRHKKSVVNIGVYTLTFFPEYFPTLRALPSHQRWFLLKAYLELHDNPKLWMWPDSIENTPSSEKIPLENMQANWKKAIPEYERGWINELNSRESIYKSRELMKVLARLGIKTTQNLIDDLFNLEDLADVLDTKINRWKEMGHKKDPGPLAAEKYFRSVRKLELLAEIARKVEISMGTERASCMHLF